MSAFETIAKTLPRQMCRVLIDHIDGPLPLIRHGDPRALTVAALLRRGLLRITGSGDGVRNLTTLSERGRNVLSLILAEYADALTRAGGPSGAPASRDKIVAVDMALGDLTIP